VLALESVVGLDTGPETVERSVVRGGREVDLVSHDAGKFLGMVAKRNGYVLEQVFSPLVLHSTPWHEELKDIAGRCVTRYHAHHYLGFAETQWRLFAKETPPRVKPLLYVYRVLLTGLHLMRTGTVESNLPRLNEEYRLPYLPDLIARKLSGAEKSTLSDADLEFHRREFERLRGDLETAHSDSRLPETPPGRAALHDLLVRLRLSGR
jgi:predicted nucleotidyltransferase